MTENESLQTAVNQVCRDNMNCKIDMFLSISITSD